VQGIDPSEGQLGFARKRHQAAVAQFRTGNAMALPLPDNSVDAAVMALVIFFVPDPDKGVAEMARVVRPGGLVSAYAWDMDGGGFPFDPVSAEMRKIGLQPGVPPRSEAAHLDQLQRLWSEAGLSEIETRAITVERQFASFDEYWRIALTTPSYGAALAGTSEQDRQALKRNVKARVADEGPGGFRHWGRAHAVKGKVG
jgi:ubiquinone/menaquinone biosynthesis C-methylase UbiE